MRWKFPIRLLVPIGLGLALLAWFAVQILRQGNPDATALSGSPPPEWKAPVEKDQDMSHTGWLRFEAAFLRRDRAEVERWIGTYVSFTAEPYVSSDESLVRARRIDADDPVLSELWEQMQSAMRVGDTARIEAAAKALGDHAEKVPRILCRLDPHSAHVILHSDERSGFSTFDVRGVLRKVNFESGCIWVDPVFFKRAKVSL